MRLRTFHLRAFLSALSFALLVSVIILACVAYRAGGLSYGIELSSSGTDPLECRKMFLSVHSWDGKIGIGIGSQNVWAITQWRNGVPLPQCGPSEDGPTHWTIGLAEYRLLDPTIRATTWLE